MQRGIKGPAAVHEPWIQSLTLCRGALKGTRTEREQQISTVAVTRNPKPRELATTFHQGKGKPAPAQLQERLVALPVPQIYRREPPQCKACGGPHKAETFRGRAPLPVTPGHRGQAAGDRRHGGTAGTAEPGPSRTTEPGRGMAATGPARPAVPHHPVPREAANPPQFPGPGRAAPRRAGSSVPALHGGDSPVRDHRREPSNSSDSTDRTRQNDSTERDRETPTYHQTRHAPPL